MGNNLDIKAIRKKLKMNQQDFADKLGYTQAYISELESGKKPMSTSIGYKISQIFEISPEELSSYNIASKIDRSKGLPVYTGVYTTGSVQGLFRDEHNEESLFYLDAPEIRDCDYGVRMKGDSMYPLIANGGYVACKTISNKEYILYGEIFHVITADYSTVKFIKPHPKKEGWILLVPYNDSIAPTPMPKSEILKISQVMAILNIR